MLRIGSIFDTTARGNCVVPACIGSVKLLAISACLCWMLWAQAPDPRNSDANQSWKTTHDARSATDSSHTVESHTKIGNRTIHKQTTEIRGTNGEVSGFREIETESVEVNPSTLRAITRTFVRGADGKKTLLQQTEEETQTFPGGGSKSVRTTSNPDLSGNLQTVQRDVSETKKLSRDVEVTNTTVMLPSVNGGLAPATKIEERKQHVGDNTEFQKTTRLLDGGGNWKVSELRQGTIKDEGKNQTTEEHISRDDGSGNFREVSRTVKKEAESSSGEKRSTVETYSIDVAGSARDSNLHLIERDTTTESGSSSGQQSRTEQVEQPNFGDPASGSMRVIQITNDTTRTGPSGMQATRTVQVRNGSGSYDTVMVDTSKSDNKHAIQVQIAPPAKPTEKASEKPK